MPRERKDFGYAYLSGREIRGFLMLKKIIYPSTFWDFDGLLPDYDGFNRANEKLTELKKAEVSYSLNTIIKRRRFPHHLWTCRVRNAIPEFSYFLGKRFDSVSYERDLAEHRAAITDLEERGLLRKMEDIDLWRSYKEMLKKWEEMPKEHWESISKAGGESCINCSGTGSVETGYDDHYPSCCRYKTCNDCVDGRVVDPFKIRRYHKPTEPSIIKEHPYFQERMNQLVTLAGATSGSLSLESGVRLPQDIQLLHGDSEKFFEPDPSFVNVYLHIYLKG